ncbi:hypothetical protein EFP17_09195 [Burkholderia glumae]|nr:hypothetical protein EFP17_09195 [Burkholderia glumae]
MARPPRRSRPPRLRPGAPASGSRTPHDRPLRLADGLAAAEPAPDGFAPRRHRGGAPWHRQREPHELPAQTPDANPDLRGSGCGRTMKPTS